MNGPTVRPLLLTLTLSALLLSATPQSADRVLVKIDRRQPVAVAADALVGITALQELSSGWIAEASGEAVARLQASGVSLQVLDPAPSGQKHFLVFAPPGESLEAVRALGAVVPLEERIYLLASSTENVRPVLPAGFSLSRLPASANIRMAFETAGAARAVPRAQASASPVGADPRIAQMVGQVSPARLAALIRQLESFQTRYASTSNCESAGTSIYEYFRDLGVQAEADDFIFSTKPYTTSNIIATIPGQADPDQVVIMCSHYDSYSNQAATLAPGADDNATGTSAVMEAARVLAAYGPFDFTIKLIAFSAEEWGLYGSKHYAADAKQRGEKIIGVVNLDMIGYADSMPEDLDVTGNPASEWLASRFQSTTAIYEPLPILKKVSASERSSDHAPFWDQGYSAVECIEDTPLKNPYYHKTTDTSATLSTEFHAAAARAALAVVADLAQPVSTPPTPAGLSATPETSRSLFAAATSVYVSWEASSGARGYHIYRAISAHGPYSRITASPVTATSYVDRLWSVRKVGTVGDPPPTSAYYVVTAVDSEGRESNRSAEVMVR